MIGANPAGCDAPPRTDRTGPPAPRREAGCTTSFRAGVYPPQPTFDWGVESMNGTARGRAESRPMPPA
jgi:hypothetical protein